MTPAQKSDADELPALIREACDRAFRDPLPGDGQETPEQIEARAWAETDAGHGAVGAHLRGYAHGIREGERRATARIVAALHDMTGFYARGVANVRGGDADLVREIAAKIADDIEAGRL